MCLLAIYETTVHQATRNAARTASCPVQLKAKYETP